MKNTITYNKSAKTFTLQFAYSAKIVGDIKKHFDVRKYNPETKTWTIPVYDNAEKMNAGTLYNYWNKDVFQADEETQQALKAAYFGKGEFFAEVQ